MTSSRGFDVKPGIPAYGHVSRGGHWHPGSARNCHRCNPKEQK